MEGVRENDLRKRKSKKTEIEESSRKLFASEARRVNKTLPDAVGYGLVLAFLVVIKFFYNFENSLPDQITIEEAHSHPDRFIGQRAELQLKRLTDLGTRVVGSYENEVLAVDFLKREISFIAQEAKSHSKIEVDVQKPTGSYYLAFKPHGFRNYYANIQNVVVKLSSSNSTNAVLLNCHYDTVPESPGASDNGLNCAVLLEILRVLSSSKTPLKNSVIFLFNGAEENPLQASHGFLSQHKWSKNVKVLINLDSAGPGGKELLFQTSGESWLMKAYAKAVPSPTAGVQAEELFHFGIIPSDTDFRVFRDFGAYPGFDIAHFTNGYIYHTKYDKMEYISPGVYQHTGDNILALVRELVNSPELGAQHSKSRLVYFDVFGLFVVVYTESLGTFINLATSAVSFSSIVYAFKNFSDRKDSLVKTALLSIGGQLLGLLLSGAFVLVTSKTLDFYNSTMSWYLRSWLIVPLYIFPIVLASVWMLLLVQVFMRKHFPAQAAIKFINGAQFLWTIILLAGTLKGVRTSFMLMLIILPPSVGSLIVSFFKKPLTENTYLLTYLSCLIFPTLFTIHQAVRVFIAIIPMTARMGPHTNSEVIIGTLAFLTSAVYLFQTIPVLLLLRKLRTFLIVLALVHILSMIAVIGTNFGFPYNGDIRNPVVQRFNIFHTDRTFHNAKGNIRKTDSGIFVLSLDRNDVKYVSKFLPELTSAKTAFSDCSSEIFCGFPVFTSRFIRPAGYGHWVPAKPPTIHHPTSLEVLNQTQVSVHVRRVRILITGPDHISIGMSPRENVKLLAWSFDEFEPIESENFEGRKTYMVYYSHGLTGGSLEFDVDLEITDGVRNYVMDIAVVGHYMHDKKFRTNEFNQFLSRFPDWAHLSPWTATYKSWVI